MSIFFRKSTTNNSLSTPYSCYIRYHNDVQDQPIGCTKRQVNVISSPLHTRGEVKAWSDENRGRWTYCQSTDNAPKTWEIIPSLSTAWNLNETKERERIYMNKMLLLLALSANISFVCQLLKTAGVLVDR